MRTANEEKISEFRMANSILRAAMYDILETQTHGHDGLLESVSEIANRALEESAITDEVDGI